MNCPDLLAFRAAKVSESPDLWRVRARAPNTRAAFAVLAGLASGAACAQPSQRSAAEWTLVSLAVLVVLALVSVCAWLVVRERRANQRLRQVRLQLRALSDVLDVWQWRSGADHRITGLRPPLESGAQRWSGSGVGATLWERFPALDVPALRARLDAHAPLVDVEVKLADVHGAQHPGWLRATTLSDADGRFAGYIGVVREGAPPAAVATTTAVVVPLRAASALVQVAPAPASMPASAPTSAIASTSSPGAPAESADESFMYTLSHDLRAPIRVVDGFARILKEDYGRQVDRIGNDHIDRVLGAAARMSSMIDALLNLSRLSARPLEREPVNLSQLASYVAEDLRRQSPQRQVTLHLEPDMEVHGDPTLLRMVLENLIGNAWKYTGKRADAEIWFERNPAEGPNAFTVRDNGAGFDMRFADRLFGAFQRLHSATEFQGTGVGLVSVKRIVSRHGGEIWAESAPGEGARFHFTLGPRVAPATGAAGVTKPSAPQMARYPNVKLH